MEPACDGEAFNVTNGDVFRWQDVWPAIAEALGMALPGSSSALVKNRPRAGATP